ncbi:hypothetical protein E8P82_05525 [Arthrobacter echini]|uniref:Cell division protein FtsL n=1 Tax=Arthrobacter echini TaxID=1529066 RepID=A0A4S5E7J5_9MICC|nr:hypothetical protein [Arthrobacter echini]THJ67548.1 hypothetical protein E8P82_05525 [Arthrobacter echini]
MSQAVTVDKRHGTAAFSGSGALAVEPGRLTGIAADVGAPERTRTPLTVVPARSVRRRLPLAVFLLALLAGALATVLMLNISVSGTQYELVRLRNEQVALTQQNEALVLEIQTRQAPQNLAARAAKLGMVPSPSFGTIDLESKRVTGVPEPAVEGSEPGVLIAPPNLTGTPAPAAPEEDAGEESAAAEDSR